MNQLSMTSALFPRTVGRIAVALTFVVPLVSAPAFAQARSSKSKATAGESSNAAPKLIQPEELARIVQSPKARGRSSSRLVFGFFICRRTFRIRSTSALRLSPQVFSVCASGFKVCHARNTSLFTAGAVLGANAQTLIPHTTGCAPWDSAMLSSSTLRTTLARTGLTRVIPWKRENSGRTRFRNPNRSEGRL